MFDDFAHVWTPVLLCRTLRRRPVGLTLADVPVVLFRDGQGRVAALVDRCPQRGAALSLGRRTDAGLLACPCHGWLFDASGRGKAAYVPRCMPLTAHEAGGLVWLYTGFEPPTSVPHVPEHLRSATPNLFALEVAWQTHWTRCMENMIDNAHVPFVHRRTVGWRLWQSMRADSQMQVDWRATPHGLFIEGIQDGRLSVGVHEFNRPNGMVLYVDGRRGRVRVHIYCIPVQARLTRLLVVGHFGRTNWLARCFVPFNRRIVLEDRAVVESSQPPEVPPLGVEPCVATDRGTQRFRKYYYEALKGSSAVLDSSLRIARSSDSV